jgi:hypothetical protein
MHLQSISQVILRYYVVVVESGSALTLLRLVRGTLSLTQQTTHNQRVGVAENIRPVALYSENTLKASSLKTPPSLRTYSESVDPAQGTAGRAHTLLAGGADSVPPDPP